MELSHILFRDNRQTTFTTAPDTRRADTPSLSGPYTHHLPGQGAEGADECDVD